MSESHAYGRSLGCVSRRLFVLGVSVIMLALCCVQLARWLLSFHLWDAILDNAGSAKRPQGCVGRECYEVLTCFGMRDATLHLREPLTTFAGLALLPWAISGAHHMTHSQLRVAAAFFAASAAFHLAIALGDLAYVQTCGAFSGNMIEQALLNWMPPSPITNAARGALRRMEVYVPEDVTTVTGGFRVAGWYAAVAGTLVGALAYVARETDRLGDLAERGPLGFGMHFGLGQWDEILDHDAIRRHKRREVQSAFLEDARLPSVTDDFEAEPLFYAAGLDYGATVNFEAGAGAGDFVSMPADYVESDPFLAPCSEQEQHSAFS
mmetsp:Transcript_63480/g.184001  ORF Transcript_63480/g.184001 Transcript_63480/m.184001 type:complete len:322 (-) Transcript_63480:91-1056(-)